MLRVSVSTRRLRSSSGAMVLKMVARRSDAWPSSASAVASSCATLTSSNAAAMPATTGTAASSALCMTCMMTCGSSCVAAVAMLVITSGSRSGDITATMLLR